MNLKGTSSRPLKGATLAIVGLTGAAIVGSAWIAWQRIGPSSGSSRNRQEHVAKASVNFTRRTILESSGYAAVLENLRPWSTLGSLTEVASRWDRVGFRNIEAIDRLIANPRMSQTDRVRLQLLKSTFYNFEGQQEDAYKVLEGLRRDIEASPELAKETLATLLFLQAIVALRRGENDNCVMCRGESSCILPIAEAAVHRFPSGSRLAIKHLDEYLKIFPDDLEAKWLLNVAYMTLGEYPSKVPFGRLVSVDRFVNSTHDIGRFRDVGHLVGVNRFNQAGGAIMEDFDADGLLDLAVTSFDPTMAMAIYRNRGDGTFEDRTAAAKVGDQNGGGLFCCQTDYDNDGRLDIWISRGAWLRYPVRPSLLHNNGDGTFSDITERADLGTPLNANSAVWGDYDNDGWLDLFVPCEQQANRLYHNKGDGTFEEVAAAAGVDGGGESMCKGASWTDFDNDDDLDLFFSFLGSAAKLFRNNGDGTFTDVSGEMGIVGPRVGFSCWTWDYDNDGWLDIFATSYERTLADIVKGLLGEKHGCDPNRLYHNEGGKRFVDVTADAGLDMVFATMGSNFADFNNDGYLDFYLGTGDPDLSTLVPNRMFLNLEGKHFAEITGTSRTGNLQKGHAVACGDWDRDGDVDLFIQMGGVTNGDKYHNILFQNPGQGNHALGVRLIGKKTNRAAYGARIKAVVGGDAPHEVHRVVSSGSSFGANTLEQTIGTGKATKVDRLEIHWPTSGTTQVLKDVGCDQVIEVTEFVDQYRNIDVRAVKLAE